MINCEDCKFFKSFSPASDEGECRRYAPTARRPRFNDMLLTAYAVWPTVLGDIDCCGEAVRKIESLGA